MKTGRPITNLMNKQFGYWEVLNLSFVDKHGAHWACLCHGCGKVYDVRSDSLQSGRSTKCKECAAYEREYKHACVV